MEHADEHEDHGMQVEVAVNGVHAPFRFRNKKRSKVWEEYKPVFANGKIQSAECRYCHNLLSCKDSNGTSHLWRHQKICPAKVELAERQQDAYFPYVMVNGNDSMSQIIREPLDDINLVTRREKSRFKSKVWKEFRPIYVEERLQSADCIYCHKRLSANKFGGRSHLKRHLQTCPARGGMGHNHQKSLFYSSSLANLKSRMQDELSPALTNGKVQIAEYSSKLLRNNRSGDTTPLNQYVQALPVSQALPSLEVTIQKKQKTSYSPTTSPDVSTRQFDQEASYKELTRMIVLHEYPLSIVEHEEMKRFAKSLNTMFNMVSPTDMEERCSALFQKEKVHLKEKIALSPRRVSLSASIWTSDGAEPMMKYLCVTAHFIDEDWKVHQRIIKFGVFWFLPTDLERMIYCKEACIPDSESGSYNVIWDAIRDWNLDQKLLSLTSVGEIKNDENTSMLKETLIENNLLPIKGKLFNIACVDDVLNSIVSKGHPDMLRLVGDVVTNFFLAHASSLLTRQQLLEVISQMGLKCPREDAKLWHKFYFRLEVLLHFKKSFPSEELLSPEDMKAVESICKILRTFYRAIEVISGPSSLTANVYFNELWKVRTALQEEALNDNSEIAIMVMEMLEAFNEYWQTSYLWLSIPVVLDPRFKISFIEFRLKQAFGTHAASYVSEILETIRQLFDEYFNSVNKPSSGTLSSEACGVEMDADDSDSLEDWDQHLNAQARSQTSTELDNYLEDGLVPRTDDFDILNWWMSYATKYPTLAVMAQDILAVPASAVQPEAAFSRNGPVIRNHHSTLNIKTMEVLVCSRDWIR